MMLTGRVVVRPVSVFLRSVTSDWDLTSIQLMVLFSKGDVGCEPTRSKWSIS